MADVVIARAKKHPVSVPVRDRSGRGLASVPIYAPIWVYFSRLPGYLTPVVAPFERAVSDSRKVKHENGYLGSAFRRG
jgi:hypothetical protein